jgi:hypothetical protein
MLDATKSFDAVPLRPRNNDFLDPDCSNSPGGPYGRDARDDAGRGTSAWAMSELLKDMKDVVEFVEAAVLLLDRRLKTEFRFVDDDLCLCSWVCITP